MQTARAQLKFVSGVEKKHRIQLDRVSEIDQKPG